MSEERIAYEELRPGTEVQAGDQYRNTQGRWVEYSMDTSGVPIVGPTAMARRPYKISTILEIGDALADAQRAATQLQGERDEACRERDLARAEVARLSTELWARKPLEDRVASLVEELAQARAEIQNLLKTITDNADQFADAGKILEQQRDEARAEVARLSTELWARKPLEDRITSLTYELANARENIQKLVKTIADNADQFAEHTKLLVHERDEARAEVQRLQEVVRTLHSEPMAWQVQQMLGAWITELNWSVGCFGSFGRAQVDIIQQTMTAVIQRIETMIHPEGNTNRDEARAEVQRLQEVVRTLHSEPMAWQVQQMLGAWITAIDWSAGCFDSAGREQIDIIQKTLIAVMERIGMLNPEGNTDGE